MHNNFSEKQSGCFQTILTLAMLIWLGVAPIAIQVLMDRVTLDDPVVEVIVLVGVASALLIPFVSLMLFARRRAGWAPTVASAAGSTIAVGYILLNALLPQEGTFIPLGEQALSTAVRLGVLVPYALLVGWITPRLVGRSPGRWTAWLGLDRLARKTVQKQSIPPLLLALILAALVTLPWPLTGALGDSLDSLGIALQVLARVIPEVLIFWGVIFYLLTSTFARSRAAALMTILLYTLSVATGFLPDGDWSAMSKTVFLFPLACLLTELRARERGIFPLLPLAFLYRALPILFVDPRDALAQGIPEIQHIVSYLIAIGTAAVLGLLLWLVRFMRRKRSAPGPPSGAKGLIALALVALVWGIWGGLYVFAGDPGFANHGFLIILNDQANLEGAAAIEERKARINHVRNTLIATADHTQADLLTELDGLGVPYRRYYIINMIRVDGHRWLMGRFENHSEVGQVILNPNVRKYPRRIPFPAYGEDTESTDPSDVQPNLAAIHADEAWAQGVMGEGIVVAGQDTGFDWEHPALKAHYRGWDGQSADHNYDWHDAWDHVAEPFDDGSHGTHTMGTVLGDDGADNRTGVAPGARWIGCRNMRRGFGNPGSYAECMEFFLAPYPHGGDAFADGNVSQAPHLVNNSWGCPDFEGCAAGTLRPAVEALRAAGIMMVVSAGNEGPACGTVESPPSNYDASFSVGATSGKGSVTSFSSRGPVDGPVGALVKPDIAAPGDSVRSSIPDGDYGYAGGTSMAGPHVAGTVALVWSAQSGLIGDVSATEALLCQTAIPKPVEEMCTSEDEVPEGAFAALLSNPVCACGDVTGTPNNVYGCGVVDAGAAVRAALEPAD
jgi:subtilisin family serine protease